GQDVVGEPDLGRRLRGGSQRLDRKTVAEHRMVANLVKARGRQRQAWREVAGAVTQFDECAQLIDREEMSNAVAELGADQAGIIDKGDRRIARLPAAGVLQRLWQGPVIERRERLGVGVQELVPKTVRKNQG